MNLNELTELLEEIATKAVWADNAFENGASDIQKENLHCVEVATNRILKEFEEMSARISALEKAGQDLYVCVEFEADPLLKDVAMQNWKKVRE